ncbi:MAG: DUF6653 family protein [Pseudomonadota bacterium]
MDLFKGAERLMAMSDQSWARHANPLSAWSRLLSAPLFFLALWSPFWIGWWGAGPIAAMAVWTIANPRLFSPPSHTRSWATQGVLGERAFLNRTNVPIPEHHRRAALLTTGLSATFLVPVLAGFVLRDFWLALTAWHAVVLSKVWFVDRMVWLWRDVYATHPVYRAWNDADWTASLKVELNDGPQATAGIENHDRT